LWQVLEASSYLPSVSLLGDLAEVEDNVRNIDYSMHRNPLGWPLVPGTKSVWLAKTKVRITLEAIVPAYRMWFRIDFERRQVHKLYLELCPINDLRHDLDEGIPF
jgi:hypothetical protein